MEQSSSAVEMESDRKLQLKKYFIAITLSLIIAIFLGQLYQDFHRKQEHSDAKRLDSHHYQAELASELMNCLLVMRGYEGVNAVLFDETARKLSRDFKALSVVQSELIESFAHRKLEIDDKVLAESEKKLSPYIDKFMLIAVEVMASIESKTMTNTSIDDAYQRYLSIYVEYQGESERFIEKLSDYLEEESYEHRMILWGVVFSIIVLVIVVGSVFYRIISNMVNREFKLLAEDNRLRRESEAELAEHSRLLSDQQMKMRSILDSTADAIITITVDGKIDSFNKAAETMFGYPASFAMGQNIKFLMPEPYSSKHDDYLRNHDETGEQKVIGRAGVEVVGKRIDGSEFPLYLSVSHVADSKPKLFTGIIQDITEWKKSDAKLHQAMGELKEKQALLEGEEHIARHVFENITASNNDTLKELASWNEPMGVFSGDMMLSSLLPSGGIRVLLCDFTGHGLPAAIGAIPVSSIHNAMAEKGLPLDILMSELNSKLKALLPTGIFCCIAGIDIDAARTHAHIWNAGLPDVLIVSKEGEIKQRVKSVHLPLGVVEYDHNEIHCSDIRLEIGDIIYAYSDGLTEAENEAGEMFGQARFEQLLSKETDEEGRLVEIRNKVSIYMGKAKATDDISLVEIKTLS